MADRLRQSMPGAGHLVHMPSHIDVLVGDYPSVIRTNQHAIEADAEFVQREGANNFVAEAMVAGEIAYRKGEFETAFEHLREAVRLDDAMNYDEPWGWMQPARHALGALLLEAGNISEAAAVFRADLKRHPSNPWALHGLAESLTAQGKLAEAAKIKSQFQAATARADVRIDRSLVASRSRAGNRHVLK